MTPERTLSMTFSFLATTETLRVNSTAGDWI